MKFFRCGPKGLQEAEGSFYSLIISELAPLAGIKKDFIVCCQALIGFSGYGSTPRLFFKSSKKFTYQFWGHNIAAEIGAGGRPGKEGKSWISLILAFKF